MSDDLRFVSPAPRLPKTWKRGPDLNMDGQLVPTFQSEGGLRVIFTLEDHRDGKEPGRWLHLSVSRRSRLPSWDDLKACRNIFFGPEVEVIQVLAPESEWVNVHNWCLHLWQRLPDLTPDPGKELAENVLVFERNRTEDQLPDKWTWMRFVELARAVMKRGTR